MHRWWTGNQCSDFSSRFASLCQALRATTHVRGGSERVGAHWSSVSDWFLVGLISPSLSETLRQLEHTVTGYIWFVPCQTNSTNSSICLLLLLVWHAPLGCIAPNADISLQSGRFWATVIASSSERLFDLRSCWIVFIHVVRWRPGGLLQSSEGEAVMILLASVLSCMWVVKT